MWRNVVVPILLLGWGLAAAQAAAAGETLVERGAYLVRGPVACGNCHTVQGPVRGPELAGGMVVIDAPGLVARAANITPDKETGIGAWTDAEIVTAIREGRRPDGSTIGPPMPFGMYRMMSDADVTAIVAYLRTVAPVTNRVASSTYPFALPPSHGPPVGVVPAVSPADPVAYGHYLATALAHCLECHSTPGPHGPDVVDGLGAGGMRFPGPWGESIAANLTPTGIGHYSDTELQTIITTGVRPDGSHLLPPMGVAYYAHMSPQDVSDIVAYLRTLPAK